MKVTGHSYVCPRCGEIIKWGENKLESVSLDLWRKKNEVG